MAANDIEVIANQGVIYRRFIVNTYGYQKFGGVVQYGPLKGFKILEDTAWGVDKGAKLLGFYELEILNNLAEDVQGKYFVDVGAADGYYAVGFIFAGIAKKSIAFEAAENGREIIRSTANNLGLLDKINIQGAATLDFIDDVDFPLDETVFLIDIEGEEFNILTKIQFYMSRFMTFLMRQRSNFIP